MLRKNSLIQDPSSAGAQRDQEDHHGAQNRMMHAVDALWETHLRGDKKQQRERFAPHPLSHSFDLHQLCIQFFTLSKYDGETGPLMRKEHRVGQGLQRHVYALLKRGPMPLFDMHNGMRRGQYIALALAVAFILSITAVAKAQAPTWQEGVLAQTDGLFYTAPSVTANATGTIYAAWRTPSNGTITIASWENGAWNTQTTLTTTNAGVGFFSDDLDLAVADDGSLHLAFRARADDSRGATRMLYYGIYREDAWTIETVWAAEHPKGFQQVSAPSIALTTADEPQIAFVTTNASTHNHTLSYAVRSNGNWQTTSIEQRDAAAIGAPDLWIGDAAHIAVVIHNTEQADDALFYATNTTGDWVFTLVDGDNARTPEDPRIVARDSLNGPDISIAYYDAAQRDALQATQTDAEWVTARRDGDTSDRGRGIALGFDAERTVLAYIGEPERNLHIATELFGDALQIEQRAGAGELSPAIVAHIAPSHTLVVISQHWNDGVTELRYHIADTNRDPAIDQNSPAQVEMDQDGAPTPFTLELTASDPDGDTLSWSVLDDANNGAASVESNDENASVNYVPTDGFAGSDRFTIQVEDDWGASAQITVEVTIRDVNDNPIIAQGNGVAVTMSEDGDPTPFALALSATDVDNTPEELGWRVTNDPTNGMASISGDGTEATVLYTPNAHYAGTDMFTLEVFDGNGGTAQTVVTVQIDAVDDAPVVQPEGPIEATISEDSDPTAFAPVELVANDADGNTELTWSVTLEPSIGQATLEEGNAGTVTVRYTPNANVSGDDTFTVSVQDPQGNIDAVEFRVTIEPINDPPMSPTLTPAEVFENLEPGAVVGMLTASDLEDTEPLSFALVAGNGDTDNSAFTIENAQLVTATQLDFEANAARNVRIRVEDSDGAGVESALMVTVLDANDPPMVIVLTPAQVFDIANADEQVGTLEAIDQDEGDTHTFQFVAGDGAMDNTLFTIDGNTVRTAEALDAGDRETYTILVEANDGTSTFAEALTLQIVSSNTPIANDDIYTVDADTVLTIEAPGVLENDTTATDGELTAVLVDDPTDGTLALEEDGAFTYTPEPNASGEDSFTYQAALDGVLSEPATVTITRITNPGDDVGVDVGTDTNSEDTGREDTSDESDTAVQPDVAPDAVLPDAAADAGLDADGDLGIDINSDLDGDCDCHTVARPSPAPGMLPWLLFPGLCLIVLWRRR